MNRLPSTVAALACAAAAIVTLAACDGGGPGRYTEGLVSSPSATFAVAVAPMTMPLIPTPSFLCPSTQPFTTNFDLILVPTFEVIVDGLTLEFVDGFGARSTTFFTGTRLTSLLGATTLLSGARRTIALQPQFGCGLAIPRSISVSVGMVDTLGSRHDATATASLQ